MNLEVKSKIQRMQKLIGTPIGDYDETSIVHAEIADELPSLISEIGKIYPLEERFMSWPDQPSRGIFLDLSFSGTGWTADSNEASVESGIMAFKLRKDKAPAYRFYLFNKWALETFTTQNPGIVIYEEPHLQGRGATHALVGLATRIEEICAVQGIPCFNVHTQTLKRLATGYGNATKEGMKARAKELYRHYDPDLDPGGDEADSLMIRHVYRTHGLEAMLPKKKTIRSKKS